MRKIGTVSAALGVLLWTSCADTAEDPLAPAVDLARAPISPHAAVVSNDADAGAGSFRAALGIANENRSIRIIRIDDGVGAIGIESTLAYTGSQPLRIEGAGATVDAAAVPPGGHAFVATGGGDVTFHDITFGNADGNGVLIEIPGEQAGHVTVTLRDATLRDNGLSGLYIDDQAGGSNSGGADSDAGIILRITDSHITDNGFRPDIFDFDGVRVDEGGNGRLFAVIVGSTFTGNAGDGVDLDEEGFGSIGAWLTRAVASGNTDSNIAFTEDEVELRGGNILFVFRDVHADDSHDDDGFKAEEFGVGHLNGLIATSSFDGNDDDGVQVEQNDAGSGILRLLRVATADNGDDAINPSGVRVIGE